MKIIFNILLPLALFQFAFTENKSNADDDFRNSATAYHTPAKNRVTTENTMMQVPRLLNSRVSTDLSIIRSKGK